MRTFGNNKKKSLADTKLVSLVTEDFKVRQFTRSAYVRCQISYLLVCQFDLSMLSAPGGLHRRPSELVDKILKTLREREMEFQRSGSLALSQGSHAIPARFKVMDPNRTTFSALVKQVAERDRRDKPASFRSLARSVLSRENRIWRQQQIRANNQVSPELSMGGALLPHFNFQKATQLLVIGGKSFIVDDEGNEEELLDNSKQSVLSEESGFNEEADDGGEGEGGHSQHTQLLYTRKNDRKSFTEYFSNDNSSDKSAK